jgi:hypothetical protein
MITRGCQPVTVRDTPCSGTYKTMLWMYVPVLDDLKVQYTTKAPHRIGRQTAGSMGQNMYNAATDQTTAAPR